MRSRPAEAADRSTISRNKRVRQTVRSAEHKRRLTILLLQVTVYDHQAWLLGLEIILPTEIGPNGNFTEGFRGAGIPPRRDDVHEKHKCYAAGEKVARVHFSEASLETKRFGLDFRLAEASPSLSQEIADLLELVLFGLTSGA